MIRLNDPAHGGSHLPDLIAHNTRNARDMKGDLAAMVGAAQLGARRVHRLIDELSGGGRAAGRR